jgi:hypothetical protein
MPSHPPFLLGSSRLDQGATSQRPGFNNLQRLSQLQIHGRRLLGWLEDLTVGFLSHGGTPKWMGSNMENPSING